LTENSGRRIVSSGQRFRQYKEQIRRRAPDDGMNAAVPGRGRRAVRRRMRSSWSLIRSFFGLLRGQRLSVAFALSTLTISTVLSLVPPAATKFVIDNVLDDKPLPKRIPKWISVPADRWELLVWITAGVAVISLIKIALHVGGRWYATRATKRLQLSVRKRVFEHAVRLPLHRVHELKAGGAASVLREDAGSVGELIFGMLYNPWRAVIQLAGS
jgi:ATP-binding cassette subfamily B protein/subfamily B ATP-binding cassette protein MsbA